MTFRIDIAGEYGDTDGSIHLFEDSEEIVMWDSAEWVEDPSLVYVIANAIKKGFEGTLVLDESDCRHCGHGIITLDGKLWVAPDAGFDTESGDGIWREICPDNEDFPNPPHEPSGND